MRKQASGLKYPRSEVEKQERYVQWLFIIAEARSLVLKHAPLDMLIACETQAREVMRGIDAKWVKDFQNRDDYADRVKSAMGPDIATKTIEYLSKTRPFG